MRGLLVFGLLCPAIQVNAADSTARHGLTVREYETQVKQLAAQGSHPMDVSVFSATQGERVAGIWLRQLDAPVARIGMTASQYQSEFERQAARGYRLICISGYESGGSDHYAAIWKKTDGRDWTARHALTERQYQTTSDALARQGYRLTWIDGYAISGEERYAAIWEKRGGAAQITRHGMTSDEHIQAFHKHTAEGYRLRHISAYTVGPTDRYATIWENNAGGDWLTHHRMSDDVYQTMFDRYAAQGYHVARVDGYHINGQAQYAAIWERGARQSPPREFHTGGRIISTGRTDPRLKPLDNLMTTFLKQHNVPGASLAVMRHGRLVYSRGFGFADVDNKEPVQADSLFRIASISKPITAVAVLQLQDRGKLKLDDPVRQHVRLEPHLVSGASMDPRWNRVTIRQLLHHTGGWDREVTPDPMFRSVEFAQMLRVPPPADADHVIRVMLGRPLDFDPGTKYVYSNFGYCLLGRVIEAASGQTYEKYVQESVLKPLGIRSMRIGTTQLAGRVEKEVRYYDRGRRSSVFAENPGAVVPEPYGPWYLEAMDSHGGWIASAVDLVKFASAFENPARCRILKATSIREMFTRPPGRAGLDANGQPSPRYYACGWSFYPAGNSGTWWHNGGLPGTSTILVRRHDGLAWAVLFNSWQTKDGKAPASAIDPLVHRAVDSIRVWPRR